MKFSLFVHMERTSTAQSQKQLYDELVGLCEIADRGGMHAIWTGEHHGMNFTIAPNPFFESCRSSAPNKKCASRNGNGHSPILAPHQAGRRGCNDRSVD